MAEFSTSRGSYEGGQDWNDGRGSEMLRFPVKNDFGSNLETTVLNISSRSNGSQTITVWLSRQLWRTPRKAITSDALTAINPIPEIGWLLRYVETVGPKLHDIAATSAVDMPLGRRAKVPRELEVVVNDTSAQSPTHIFAIQAKHTEWTTFYPVHAIVFATQCASLRPFSKSNPSIPCRPGDRLTLPVLSLDVPSPATFPIIMDYLYTKRIDRIYAKLLPFYVPIDQVSRTCAAMFTNEDLVSCVDKVHGFWENMQCLGVFDEKLSQEIEVVWETLVGTLRIRTGARRNSV